MDRTLKVGFYGGSFDPIHNGHLNLLISLREYYELDEIWICPAFISPLKRNSFASPQHRLEMVRLATEELPYVKILDIEINRKEVSFTFDTLTLVSNAIFKNSPSAQIYLLLGEDNLSNLQNWKNIDLILAKFPLLIATRLRESRPISSYPLNLQAAIHKGLTELPILDINSTNLRTRLIKSLYCAHLIPGKVLDYIKNHRLYLHTEN